MYISYRSLNRFVQLRAVSRSSVPHAMTPDQNPPPAKIPRVEGETLRIKKLSEHAIVPVRGSTGAAGTSEMNAKRHASPRPRATRAGC